MSDIDRGREALIYFHNEASNYPAYNLTLDQLISVAGKSQPSIFLDSLGFAILANDMSTSQVKSAMETLANAGQGQVPSNQTLWFQALSNRIQNITAGDWISATPQVVLESMGDVVTGFQEVGNAVIDTGKSFLVVGPILILAAVIYIGYFRTKQYAGTA